LLHLPGPTAVLDLESPLESTEAKAVVSHLEKAKAVVIHLAKAVDHHFEKHGELDEAMAEVRRAVIALARALEKPWVTSEACIPGMRHRLAWGSPGGLRKWRCFQRMFPSHAPSCDPPWPVREPEAL